MRLEDLLRAAARRAPHDVAVLSRAGALSYSKLAERSGRVAAGLAALGVRPGERVALASENTLEAVVAFWGVLRAGAVVVDLPLTMGRAGIASAVAEARPTVLLASRRQRRALAPELGGASPPVAAVDGAGADDGAPDVEALGRGREASRPAAGAAGGADAVALVIYTSGSSGRPKGVMLSHANLIANVDALLERAPLGPSDRLLLVSPLSYVHGRSRLLAHTRVGASVVLSAGLQLPQGAADEVQELGVTGVSGVPFQIDALVERTRLLEARPERLRYLAVTGGPPTPRVLERVRAALPEVEIRISYGLTEAGPRICSLDGRELAERPGSCGRPLRGTTVEVVAEDGEPLPIGAVGEVAVSGPGVMVGYVSGDARAGGVIDAGGRLRTGDLGRLDADGYLYLCGRRSAMIKTAGERVFPGEIEAVVRRHPAVAECVVVGVPDPELGERIVAVVVPPEGATAPSLAAVRAHGLGALPFVRLPRAVVAVEALPRTPSGKVDRAALAARAGEAAAPGDRGG